MINRNTASTLAGQIEALKVLSQVGLDFHRVVEHLERTTSHTIVADKGVGCLTYTKVEYDVWKLVGAYQEAVNALHAALDASTSTTGSIPLNVAEVLDLAAPLVNYQKPLQGFKDETGYTKE